MPNRILRDWTDSEAIDSLTVHAERFFTRLIMKVDDFGRYSGNFKIIRSALFPLKTDVRETDISRWIAECEKAGLIVLYNVASREYLQIENFKQSLRQKKEKYPAPQMHSTCTADDTQTHSTCSPETETRNETESETETNRGKPPDVFKKLELKHPFSDEFIEHWIKWKDFKKTHFRFLFKSIESEQAALSELINNSGADEPTAIRIIEKSIANGWKGLFELKEKNGTHQHISAGSSKQSSNNALLERTKRLAAAGRTGGN